jgi:hypothetical protein
LQGSGYIIKFYKMAVHVLGIRHHGPGSARNIKQFLEELRPDIVLVEGPPEADDILQWATHKEIKPPVAILCYQPDNPHQSSFYPFAEFSPEWQAILYAGNNNIHVRFMDLPIANYFAIENEMKRSDEKPSEDEITALNNYGIKDNEVQKDVQEVRNDPMSYLAEVAGFTDSEKWWEHTFEHRHNTEEVFEAVKEAMEVLREAFPNKSDERLEQLREAHMRKVIRQAEREMFQNIAVICGAWHTPALVNMPKQKEDNDLLKGLPKVKVECTWIPWTYNRLSYFSGYGAGITSPGWYEHIWKHPADNGTLWMAKVAKLFREKQMDTSVAHVIEAIRLAGSLASLRHLNKAGLEELNEATLAVLCNGENVLLSLVNRELIISDKIGEVPDDIPKPPLQLDIEKTQKRLRLPVTADWKDYTLDLRKENDLERSIFLHRLHILNIKWGERSDVSGKGTFKEHWRLQWDPAFSIDIIEKGTYGNTTEEAASKYVVEQSGKAETLTEVCGLLSGSIPAELHQAIEVLILQINNLAAASGDVIQLMEVLPGLVNTTRYGNVRKTDADLVLGIVNSMITRICISLPSACTGIDEDASQHLFELYFKMNDAVNLLQQDEISRLWQQTLKIVADNKNSSPIIAGYATRLMVDHRLLAGDELVKVFYYAMSSASAPGIAAAWLEGFLRGSGTLLLLDNELWSVINEWVNQLDEEVFSHILPLLRRTFSSFSQPERRKLGEKAVSGGATKLRITEAGIDEARAVQGIPVMMKLFGYKNQSNGR